MHIQPLLALMPVMLQLVIAFPNPFHRCHKVPSQTEEIDLLKPLPTSALLAGVLSSASASELAKIIEDYPGDLGGEKPILRGNRNLDSDASGAPWPRRDWKKGGLWARFWWRRMFMRLSWSAQKHHEGLAEHGVKQVNATNSADTAGEGPIKEDQASSTILDP